MNDKAKEILGHPGRMVSGSKSLYRRSHPLNFVVFNANVIAETEEGLKKIWYGDIDITESENDIQMLAEQLETRVYVVYELAARFENEEKPDVANFAYSYSPEDGAQWHPHFKRFVYRAPETPVPEGSLVCKDVADDWKFELKITEPEPSEEEIRTRIKNAKAWFKEEHYDKFEIPEDAPDFSHFLEHCTSQVSPFMRFRVWLKETHGLEIEWDQKCKTVVLNDYDMYQLNQAQKAWSSVFCSHSSLFDRSDDERFRGPEGFYGAPEGYSADPDWVEQEYMYVRK
jgi:hypothetical protein